jgi:hypothetical protein
LARLGAGRARGIDSRPVSNPSDDDRERILTAQREADALGYRLVVEEAPNIEPVTHMAVGFPVVPGQGSMGRFLAYGTSAAEAAENGADVLQGIVERDDPWPEETRP